MHLDNMDEPLIRAFRKAIAMTVKNGDVVLNCGVGSGILAILAAKYGANVVALNASEIAKENVANNGVSVEFVKTISRRVDVAVINLFDTMLVGEQIKTVNSLIKRGVVDERTKVIPLRSSNFFEMVCYDFEFFECLLPMMIKHPSADDRCIDILSSAYLYGETDFTMKNPLKFSHEGKHVMHANGWINAIKFSTVTHLTEDLIVGSTPCYVPAHQMAVKPGDVVSCKIDYQTSGYDSVEIQLS